LKKKLLFLVNVDWFFLTHRLPIALEALNKGYEVHVATGITDKLEVLRSHGLIVHPLPIGRSSTGLISETHTFWNILQVFIKVRPHVAHLVTIKPVFFGGIVARLTFISEARTFWRILQVFIKVRPHTAHLVTIKPMSFYI
jgi:hypothetical protein